MVRSAAAILAVLMVPSFAASQQMPTHTVVDGDTLWELAERYYSDPFDWRRIWQANQTRVADPNLILPGQQLVIPGPDGAMPPSAPGASGERLAEVDVSVEGAAGPAGRSGPITQGRTLFYRDTSQTGAVLGSAALDYRVVSRDIALSAPWLIETGRDPSAIGTLERFAGTNNRSETPRSYDRVRFSFDGPAPPVGANLRTYRVTHSIEGVGQVVRPTGLLSVTDVDAGVAVAVVTQEYARIGFGDEVGPLPEYGVEEGVYPEAVMDGPRAMIMGFAGFNEVQDVGSVAFLDLGAEQGIAIGDEFEYLNPLAGSNVVEGRLQVVGVRPGMASARIMEMDDAVFEQGIVVRLARRMP